MKNFFDKNQYESLYPRHVERHWWHLTRNRIISDAIQSISTEKPQVIDIGCGIGIVLNYLRHKGIKCYGFEPSNPELPNNVSKFVWSDGDINKIPESIRYSFNTILLLDVIEHIADPISFLQDLELAFPKVSTVIVTVPARPELWSNFDEFNGHYRRYTLGMVEELSRQLNWKLTRNNYFFHLLYIPTLLLVKLKSKRKTNFNAPEGTNKLIHIFLSKIMMLDYILLPRSFLGSSLLAAFHLDKKN